MKQLLFYAVVILFIACSASQKNVSNVSAKLTTPNHQIPALPLTNADDLDTLIRTVGDANIVLLGEATHGTAEFYNWRAEISKKLVEQKGFSVIALEADWSDTYRVNNVINNSICDTSTLVAVLKQYDRWPQWLWANNEFYDFLKWLQKHNQSTQQHVSIFGLDVFSFEEALDTLITFLNDSTLRILTHNVKQCLQPYHNDAMKYQEAVKKGIANCGVAVNRLWLSVNNVIRKMPKSDAIFLLLQNARVVFNGERYFSGTVHNRMGAWNIRDRHMLETISSLIDYYGADKKVIVWAHNTHVGDAAFTDMHGRGRSNIGEMLRKQYGAGKVFITGFATYKGTVIAAPAWDSAKQVMTIAPAREESVEGLLHAHAAIDNLILSNDIPAASPLNKWLWHRAIGVVESPRQGLLGNYVSSLIPKRYDALIYVDESHALHPLQ